LEAIRHGFLNVNGIVGMGTPENSRAGKEWVFNECYTSPECLTAKGVADISGSENIPV